MYSKYMYMGLVNQPPTYRMKTFGIPYPNYLYLSTLIRGINFVFYVSLVHIKLKYSRELFPYIASPTAIQ